MSARSRRFDKGSPVECVGPRSLRPDEVYEASAARTMEERVEALNGETTYREPMGARGTKSDMMPGEHVTAAQLAYASKTCGRLGPAVAVAVALRTDAARAECVAILSEVLAGLASASDRRAFDYAAICAWDELVHGRTRPYPVGMPAEAWSALLKLAVSVLDGERQNALREARKAA